MSKANRGGGGRVGGTGSPEPLAATPYRTGFIILKALNNLRRLIPTSNRTFDSTVMSVSKGFLNSSMCYLIFVTTTV